MGLIADIERASNHDGPGLRSVIFFKGCPLACKWCHNPECISFQPQTLFYPEKCIGCGQCKNGCYSGARVLCGREMTVDAVLEQLLQDAAYYQNSGGGVTFSGGEPQAQPEFLNALLTVCKARGIHTAIETAMPVYYPEILKKADLLLVDLKIWDDALHREYTGVSNRQILKNIQAASALGVPMVVHTPIIPGVNNTKENILAIKAFLKPLKNVTKYELLPYHPLGVPKQQALGQTPVEFKIPTAKEMEELQHYVDIP